MRLLVRSNIKEPVVALAGISLAVEPGEILALVGPNGAGKSTTFRVLIGLTSPTSGTAQVMGYDCNSQSMAVRRLVGWMPAEDRSLLLRLSCAENLRFHGLLHGMERRTLERRIGEVLEMVGLAGVATNSPFALSAGMKARLQLARALLHRPKVLVLDEPTGSVDPVAAHGLLSLIISIVEEQRLAALISSHRLEEIEALHTHVILLDKGSIHYDGDLDDLRSAYDRQQVDLEFATPEAALAAHASLRSMPVVDLIELEGSKLSVTLARAGSVADVIVGLDGQVSRLVHLHESRTPLRDILARIYQQKPKSGD
ncbi:MAG TPA: ABC transporter ATP-binding protein [Acidimicrobiia bacterium]|nr:ABC transporter ATP-binding protein [Acidimicrobiia bacterium]